MRTSLLGSVSVLCLLVAAPAWASPDEPAQFGGGEEPTETAGEPSSPATTGGQPSGSSRAPTAAPTTKGQPSGSSGAPSAAAAGVSGAANATGVPSPKQLAGPAVGPLPPPEASPLAAAPTTSPTTFDPPPPPPPPKAGRRSEWGAQFRLQGAPMGENASPDAGMGGLGFSLRPRPSPYFAIDFGLDFMGGRDFNGDRRNESALIVNPMIFLNPRNKVQIYVLAGLGLGRARVETSAGLRDYRYVGANAGGGVEFRFWQHFALSGDVVAFLRDRTDAHDGPPEYIDKTTRRYTDSSAGALIRLGGIYYW